MDGEYIVVLFKNKVRKKIVKTFKTSKRALAFYQKLIEESKKVIFNKETENGFTCKYELVLLEKNNGKLFTTYITDEYGRNVKIDIEDSNYSIAKINDYRIPDQIHDHQKKKRISVNKLIDSYLPKIGVKMISKLNNKIIVQNNEDINLFVLKNDDDASRFIDSLSEYFLKIKRLDCMFIKDISTAQRKYLYDILNEKGFSKDFLYRQVTTFGVKK